MHRISLTPIKEESSLSESRKSRSDNVHVLDPIYCPCAKFFKDLPKGRDICDDKSYSSILQKPFLFRRQESLEKAVELQERNLKAMYSTFEHTEEEEPTISSEITLESLTFSATRTTSTPCEPMITDSMETKSRDYLAEIAQMRGEDEEYVPSEDLARRKLELETEDTTETMAMRMAQKYLRIHKIFEFFQFLIAQLLGNLPENPIHFLLTLLDKCIIYRAGMGDPPLLYEKKHIGALFDLMDPMKTEYIDMGQYVTGMKTLGICSFNPKPPVTKENMVFRQIFIDEAYEQLIQLLDDILKRRWINYKIGVSIDPLNTPPPTLTQITAVSPKTKITGNAAEDIYFKYCQEKAVH